MTLHVIAYRSFELLFGTHTFHFNCFFEDFNWLFTHIRCLSRVLPVSCNFNQECYTLRHGNITAVTQTTNDTDVRLRTEDVWISKLQTREPKGLNLIQ